jgi:hypothetical protein
VDEAEKGGLAGAPIRTVLSPRAGICLRGYVWFGDFCHTVACDERFDQFIMTAVICACIMVGAQTYPFILAHPLTHVLDNFVLGIFIIEMIVKVFENPLTPWLYFVGANWRWNWFDFLIILASLPILPLNGAPMILRMARLARVVKVFNRVESLRIIIQGLGAGMNSIFSIMLLLGFVFYIFAVLGIAFFRDNDPW